jgi:hypothetical protein
MIFVCVMMNVGLAEKQTYPGDSGCSCGDALRSIFFCDATQRVDGDGSGGETGIVKNLEAGSGSDELAIDGLSEDRGEENSVGVVAAGDLDLGKVVTGHRDDGQRQVVFQVASSDIAGAKGGVRRKMDTVGLDLKGEEGGGIENEAGRGAFGGDYLQDFYREFHLRCWREVFFAELDKVDAVADPVNGVFKEPQLFLGLIAGKEAAVGNGATEHVDKFSRRRKL